MRILILGAGAMGALYGGWLKASSREVVLVDVWKEHLETIKEKGLSLEEGGGIRKVFLPACLASEVEVKSDLVLVFTKSIHTEQALESVKHLLHRETAALTLQNGLGNAEKLSRYFPPEKILVGITTFTADLLAPGRVQVGSPGATTVMQLREDDGLLLSRIKEILDGAGLNCIAVEDVFPSVWEKLAFNSAMNTLTAVTGLTVGELGDSGEARNLALQIVDEVLGVAEKKGMTVNRERIKKMVRDDFDINYGHQPSMLQDVLAGRKTEIEAINGAAVREAREMGLSLPATDFLYRLVKVLEETSHHRA